MRKTTYKEKTQARIWAKTYEELKIKVYYYSLILSWYPMTFGMEKSVTSWAFLPIIVAN